MSGYSPVLPLSLDPSDGILLNKTYAQVAKQNLKMLLLTAPGERIMDPEFGVGLQKYFFENVSQETILKIKTKINEQINIYHPYIRVLQLNINSNVKQTNDPNSISIYIKYEIKTISMLDWIKIDFNLNPDVL